MFPENTLAWGRSRSCIRELAEYGARRRAEIGAENVFDFSLGNPSIPAPACINETISGLLDGDSVALHGYTTAAGIRTLRAKIADDLNGRIAPVFDPDLIYVTCGAAAGLTISLRAILMPGDEVLVMAPFFPEYRVFSEASGGKVVIVPPDHDLMPDLKKMEALITPKTRAVILNSPNNPSGAILPEPMLIAISEMLRAAEKRFGTVIYLISDEPYRELVYDRKADSPLRYYDDAILCYSWSKALSVPGERIGYIAVGSRAQEKKDLYASILGAGRALGFVNPPSLFQRVIEKCLGATVDVSAYRKNRDDLCSGLSEIGYTFIQPDGAFYLFVRSPEPDAKAFSERAKKHELLLVPSDDFGCTGFVRIAYCVSNRMIHASMPAFRALMEEYRT